MRVRSLILLSLLVASTLAFGQTTRKDVIVSPEWLAAHPDAIVLDVASRDVYLKGHIPGARLVELQSIVANVAGTPNELPAITELERVFTAAGAGGREHIVVYSREPLLAARAWFTLDYLGQGQRTSYLDGGYARWSSEGRPISTEIPVFAPISFQASVRPALIANLKVVQSLVRVRAALGSDLALIDARAPEQFSGKEAGPGIERGGHIPGAVNVVWTDNLIAGDIPILLPDRELRELYTSAGVAPRSTNIVYCRTGMQASLTYMVLKYLGYEATLYDGSFIEWSSQVDTLVAEVAKRSSTLHAGSR